MVHSSEIFEPEYLVDHFSENEEFYEETFFEVWENCVVESVISIYSLLYKLVLLNFFFGFLNSVVHLPEKWFHILSGCIGVFLITNLLQSSYGKLILLICFTLSYFLLVLCSWINSGRIEDTTGNITSSDILKYGFILVLVLCQYILLDTDTWLEIRGIIMVFVMKILSIVSDVSISQKNFPNFLQYFGYIFSGANVMFGPWISYKQYIQQYKFPTKKSVWWIFGIARSLAFSVIFLTISNCWARYFLSENSNRWVSGYREALSFRTSHYFICYLSEASMLAAGWKNDENWHQASSWNFFVTSPLDIELPTSLAIVVVNWNKPMHIFLKKYVYRPWLSLGKFYAVLLTFIMSSFLHGFEIKVSTVLIFIGLFSFLQLSARDKMSKLTNCCIKIYPCKNNCSHKFRRNSIFCMVILFIYVLSTVLHLIFLGVLMDPSTDEIGIYQKWNNLYFVSIWMMCFNLLVIKFCNW